MSEILVGRSVNPLTSHPEGRRSTVHPGHDLHRLGGCGRPHGCAARGVNQSYIVDGNFILTNIRKTTTVTSKSSSVSGQAAESTERRVLRRRRRRSNVAGARGWAASSESARLIEFAHIWAPYGGAPSDEVFTTFGMTPARFAEELRDAMKDSGIHPDTAWIHTRGYLTK